MPDPTPGLDEVLIRVRAAGVDPSAWHLMTGLCTTGRVQAGQQVLIIGAGGGVGHLSVQIATAYGAHATGTLVLGGGENGGRWLAGTDWSMRAMLLSPFTKRRLRGLLSLPDPESLRHIAELTAAGSVIPTIARTFALAYAAAAIDYLMTSSPAGKVALTVG